MIMVRKSDAAQRLESAPLLIRRIDAIPVSVPLVQAVLMGGGQKFTRSESLVVRAEAANGRVGWGEASAAPTMTGDSLEGMVAAVERYFAPLLIGHDALDLGVLARRLAHAVIGNTGPKAACDIALHDLVGKYLGVPVSALLGGKVRASVLRVS